jgi:hypothetical protein
MASVGERPVTGTDDEADAGGAIGDRHPAVRQRRAKHDRNKRKKPGGCAKAISHYFRSSAFGRLSKCL